MNGVEKSKQSGKQAETARSKQSPRAGASRSSKCAIEPAKVPAGGENRAGSGKLRRHPSRRKRKSQSAGIRQKWSGKARNYAR